MIIMEENKMVETAAESGSKPPSTTPAYFVIVHQPQGDEKEERILVANQDASAVASVVQPGPHESKSNAFLSADCTSGGITVTLDNNNMWNEFCRCSTEMVLTKQGRRMFPYCRYWISGMDPYLKYILAMDITPLDTHKYKWNGKWWEPGGNADPHVLGRAFIHPESPSTGQYWMHQPVSFYKLKLTNNIMDQEGHIILHSMHRYLPRLHVIPADKATEVIQLNGPDVHTFTFPQTEFFAVTAYQNLQITQLKIDCNPFAKGFREGTVVGRPPKEVKLNSLAQAKDLPDSKKLEPDDPENTKKLKEAFSMSEQSDAETENESFSSKQELPSLSNSRTTILENLLLKLNQLDSLGDKPKMVTPSVPAVEPKIKIKEEPEDNYDYNKTDYNVGVQVKQEESDNEITEHSHSDDDYPILERHFAQFSTKLHSDRKHSLRNPSGVAKAKLLKLDHGKKPVVYLESCPTKKTAKKKVSKSQEPALADKTLKNIKIEECSNVPSRIISCKMEEVNIIDQKRPIKRKIYADYAVPINVRSSRGRKKKSSSTPAKAKATMMPGNDGGTAPVPKRRGRPPKNKGAKVGRPPKKRPPIETSQFPDFKPDLEDVDGVLFVAFSSKEALDVHTVGKPKAGVVSTPPEPPVHVELTAEQQKIVDLEKQLMVQLKSMRHRQVIHPALQQVGLRLNIVDHSMNIDLRYLGVELPLPFITSDSRWDNCGLSAEGLPFVSRTGKTTDYTKIKGWRDKFSANPSVKSEAASSETTLKNRSAFCSDELDEYLENEAKLMEDITRTSQNEMVMSTVSFQFPTKSACYVRTLDSVLKKQALQATSNSVNISQSPPLPVKKRKYTRRNSTPKMKVKAKTKLPSPVEKEKPAKSRSPRKSKGSKKLKRTPAVGVKVPATSQPEDRKPLIKQEAIIQPIVVASGEDGLWSKFHHTALQGALLTPGTTLFSKVQTKLLELEESAVCQGKPRTYVTEKRAEIALSALLTVQGFLKSKPSRKKMGKLTHENHDNHKPAHCPKEACMFGCNCANKAWLENNALNVTSSRSEQNGEVDVNSSTKDKPGAKTHSATPEKHTDWATVEDGKTREEPEKPCISVQKLQSEPNDEGIKTIGIKSGGSAVSSSKIWFPKVISISDSSDVDDAEPICIPEKGEVIEHKTTKHRRQPKRGKFSSSKSSHLNTSKSAVHMEDLNAEDLRDLNSISCARVRIYKRKATEEKAKKDHGPCPDSETLGKEDCHKPNKYREQEKENAGDSEMAAKRPKKSDSGGPTKLLNIISDSSREQDPKKILNVVSPHVDNQEPQSLRVGSLNIELTSNKKDGYASKPSATYMKISLAPDQITNKVTAKPAPVKERMESISSPEQIPVETRAESETNSHGGKGLPFYTKVIPAGKLVARLKDPTLKPSELVQVNGKKFPRAKLLLGQMGALHPANRIAAYITNRLQPNLLYLAKANEANAKKVDNNAGSELSTTTENLSVSTDGVKTAASLPQSKTVLPPAPSEVNTHIVMGEAGSLKKEIAEARSPEPCAIGLPKIHTQSSPPVVVSTPVSSIDVVTVVSPSVNMVSTTPSLTSSVVSPTKNQAASLPTPLIGATKLVTKDSSSVSVTATLSNNTTNTVTSTPGPSKCVSIPPPALIRAPFPPVTASVTPSYPGTNKTLAASLASSLVASANVPTIGLVSSPTGRPTITLRTVTSPSVATPRATLTSGVDKRLGPRLLLIPVSSGSTPVRPIQCAQTSPRPKMVLQPIKSPNGTNLFRHPSGQIIQLLPLQQIQGGNNQQSHRVVIRSPGPGVSIQLPLQTKTDVAIPSAVTPGSSSNPPTPALQTLSLSKISPVKAGFRVIPTSPSQIAALKIGTLPGVSSETSPSAPKVLTYASSGCGVITSTGVPFQPGSMPVLKCSTPTALSSSPQGSANKSKVILMTGKPTVVIDSNHLTNFPFLKSAVIVPSSEQNVETKSSKEYKGLSSLETDKTLITVEKESGTTQSDTSAEQKVFTQSVDKIWEVVKCTVPSQVAVNVHQSEKSDLSSRTLLQNTNLEALRSSPKSCNGFTDKEAETPSKTITMNPVPESYQDPDNPVAKSAKDNKKPAHKSVQETESSAAGSTQDSKDFIAEGAQEPENAATEKSDQSSGNPTTDSDQNLEKPLAKNDCNSVDQNSGHVEYCTMRVHSTADSDFNQQKTKSEQEEEEKFGEGDMVHVTITNEQDENLTSDPGYNSSTQEGDNNSQTEEESEVDESVDIESVQELSEKLKISRLEAKSHPVSSYSNTISALEKALKGNKKRSKVNGDDSGDEEPVSHRPNHTENERKRRNEMRDLFEELKNALCLHHLPKVSKSYILKKAKEEIEGLTDAADSLIKQKTLISQKHGQLIKKVSNLSGKPKEVVLKKLEYLYAKYKALETEVKKKDFKEDPTLKVSVKKPSLPFQPLRLENEPSNSKKPIILSRKHVPHSVGSEQSAVSTTPSLLKASTEQLAAVKEANIGQVSGISPTLVRRDVMPSHMPTGMTSVVIQLPGSIQLKGLIGNSGAPITLSAMRNTIPAASPSSPSSPSSSESETDDLSMMPRIVNVTSLADKASLDLGLELGVHTPVRTTPSTHTEVHTPLAKVTLSDKAESELPSIEDLPSTSHPVDTAETKHCVNITQSSDSSLPENLPLANINVLEALLKFEKASMNLSSLENVSGDVKNAELELELKKLSSAIAELEPNELSDVMADHEDSDETLTSLLDEIALLNQQLNNDHSDVASDMLGSDTPSQGSAGKSADGNSSPFFFGRLKELTEAKEKNISLSPFFLQLDEGEIQESAKHSEGPGIVVFEDATSKVESNLLLPPANMAFLKANDNLGEASGSDTFWRPMPKLAPLGLKSSNVQSNQKLLGNKSMPALASAVVRLGSTKPLD